MQKRVVYNFNAQTATESAAKNSTGKAVKASNAISKIKRAFSGKSIKLAVLVVLLFVSLFCTIGSADWIISQQKNVPNSQDGIFKFDDFGLNNHIDIPNVAFSGNPAQANFSTNAPNKTRDLPDEAVQNIQYKVKPYNQTSAQSRVFRAPKNAAASTAKNMAPAAYANETLPDEKFFADSKWTDKLPTDAGTYAVLIISKVGEVSYGKAIKVFTIAPCPVRIVWSGNQGFTYDGTAHPITATAYKADENGTEITGNILSISLTYKAPGAADSTAPTPVTEVKNAGTYTAAVTITNDNYAISDGEETTVTFTVTRADNAWITEPTIVANDYSDGNIFIHDVYTAKATVLSGENPTITYSSSENGFFAATQPTTAGTYYAKFIAPETTNYSKIEKTISFTIKQNTITYIDKDGSSIIATDFNGRNFDLRSYTTKNDFQYIRTAKWSDGTTEYTPGESISGITSNKKLTINITLTEKTYTLNIWYKDKDNQVSSVKTNSDTAVSTYNNQVYNFVEKIGSTTKNNVKYNTTVILKRQIRLSESYDYYYMSKNTATKGTRYINIFYMSPVEQLDWTSLYTNYKDSEYTVTTNDYLATVSGSTITLVVLCVQPQAIVSSSIIADKTNIEYSNVTYYADANDAFAACQNVSSQTYLRIYGQGQYAGNTLAYHCLTANKTINAYNFSLSSGETFTTQKYTIDINGYTINSSRFGNSYAINNNLTVILPHGRDDSSTDGFLRAQSGGSNASKGGSYIQSILTIPQNFTLTVNGTLTIGAAITAEGTVNAHGVLMNNGVIIVSAGKSLTAIGYIKGTGTVEAKRTAIINDVFKIYDWTGGANSLGVYNAGLFPFNCYSFHNISCKVIIPFGATYRAWAQLYMASSWVTQQYITILGEGGLYELTTDGYVEKYVEDTTANTNINSFTSSNQNITQREVIDIYGSFNDNTISVKAKALFTETTITTSPSLSMPMGFINISIKKGTGTLKASSYNFLPGSKVTINEGSSLTIDTNVTTVFYEQFSDDYSYTNNGVTAGYSNPYSYRNKHAQIYAGGTTDSSNNNVLPDYYAKLIVNGTLNVKGNLGGTILSTSANGKIVLNQALDATTKKLDSLKYSKTGSTATTTEQTYQANGYLQANASDISAFTNAGTYCSFADQQGYYWANEDNIKTLQLDLNGGYFSGETTFIKEKGTSITLPSEGLTKDNYLFIGWFDSSGTQYEFITISDNSPDVLYAKWEAKQYDIEYIFSYDDCTSTGTVINPNPSQYTVESNIQLLAPTDGSLFFGGWFADEEYSIALTEITPEYHGSPYIIYGKWYSNAVEHTINVVIGNGFSDTSFTISAPENSVQNFSVNVTDSDNVKIDTSYKTTDYNYANYFLGWYLDSAYTLPFGDNGNGVGAITVSANTTTAIYGKWANKIVLTIEFKDTNGNNLLATKTKYFMPSTEPIPWLLINTIREKYDTDINDGKVHNDVNEYYFNCWLENDNVLSEDDDFKLDTNKTLTASYNRCYHIVITGENITGTGTYYVLPGTDSFDSGNYVSANDGYLIISFDSDKGNISSNSGLLSLVGLDSNTDINITVSSKRTYKVTISGETSGLKVTYKNNFESGNIESGLNYLEGTTITVTAPSNNDVNITGSTSKTITKGTTDSFILSADTEISVDTGCLVEGTLITLANGTKKKVEDITENDMLLVFNHYTGEYDFAKVLFNDHTNQPIQNYTIINLYFSNGKIVKVVYEHGFFDLDENKYVYITEQNYNDYIGHRFYSSTWDGTTYTNNIVTLDKVVITNEFTKIYSPVTAYHMDYFTEDMLSMPGGIEGIFNIFEYDEDLKFNEEKMNRDIELYGEFTYEDFKDLVPEDIFNSFQTRYFTVAIGKGNLTMERIKYYIDRYGPLMI